jgi:hypothetical protein
VVCFDGLLGLAAVCECCAEAVPKQKVIRPDLQRSLEAIFRLIVAAVRVKQNTKTNLYLWID